MRRPFRREHSQPVLQSRWAPSRGHARHPTRAAFETGKSSQCRISAVEKGRKVAAVSCVGKYGSPC